MASAARVPGRLVRVNPKASAIPSHESLLAPFGGPLPARTRESLQSDAESVYELVQPRFEAIVALPPEAAQSILSGSRGDVRLSAERPPIAIVAYRGMSRWLREKIKQAEEAAEQSL